MSKIIVIGDYNADLVIYLERFPQPGETLNGRRFFEGPGGKGSNQAIATARLGADTTFFGAIGQDHYGSAALAAWKSAGVRTDYLLQSAQVETAVAMIYVDNTGDNMIAVNPGANLLLKPEHLDAVADEIAAADILMCTLGVSLAVVTRALEMAREHGTRTLLNPAPAQGLPSDVLVNVDYLTPNEGELQIVAQSGASDVTPESARHIFQRKDQTLIVTQGEAGATWVTASEMAHVPAFEVEVKDTVGAGDAFNAGFAVATAEGMPVSEAVRFANAVASLSVTRLGAVAGMPHREDVDALLARA